MTTQPLFYKKVVPLNKQKHKKLSISPVVSFKHTKDTNSLYIAAVEFLKASKEYPIVFGKAADNEVFPVVLLGLRSNENLYINKKGKWLANYIPAYVRRYPFILASSTDNGGTNFAVCIDESYPGFNSKNKGEKLFNANGKESALLQQSVKFLQEYQNHIQLTKLFCNDINRLGILEPMRANAELKGGEKLALGGFWGVNRNKLKNIAPDKLSELVSAGHMELIYAHLNSLDNLEGLLKKMN